MVKLSEEIKEAIIAEFDQWKEIMYCGQDRKERMKRGAFYTPPSLIIRMLEKLESLEGTICDPCLGAGGLIAAAIIAGADPKKCYGIELDPATHTLATERLSRLGVPSDYKIHMSMFVLDDYSHPWTDQMLYDYFGLTDEEIKIIEGEINE